MCPHCAQLKSSLDNSNIDDNTLAFKELSEEFKSTHGIPIAHLNINGLLKKIHQVRVLVEETKLGILAISETHLSSEISDDDIKIENYSFLRKDRQDDSCWGGQL